MYSSLKLSHMLHGCRTIKYRLIVRILSTFCIITTSPNDFHETQIGSWRILTGTSRQWCTGAFWRLFFESTQFVFYHCGFLLPDLISQNAQYWSLGLFENWHELRVQNKMPEWSYFRRIFSLQKTALHFYSFFINFLDHLIPELKAIGTSFILNKY